MSPTLRIRRSVCGHILFKRANVCTLSFSFCCFLPLSQSSLCSFYNLQGLCFLLLLGESSEKFLLGGWNVAKSEKEGPIKNRFEIQQNKKSQGITKETSRRSVISFMGCILSFFFLFLFLFFFLFFFHFLFFFFFFLFLSFLFYSSLFFSF